MPSLLGPHNPLCLLLPAGVHPAPWERPAGMEPPTLLLSTPTSGWLGLCYCCAPGKTPASPSGWSPGRNGCSRTHPCLVNWVVELRFYRDLAVGVGVHEGQAEARVVPTPAGQTQESLCCMAQPQNKA